LFKAGSPVGTPKTLTAQDTATLEGNMEDLWETTWADTDINNSGFRVCASLPWHRQR